MTAQFYVGLMSGTSLDGVDAVLADLSGVKPELLASAHLPLDPSLRRELLALKDRKSTRLNSSHIQKSRMPSSA